jgi:DNA-binding transcriptional LysR family regulator
LAIGVVLQEELPSGLRVEEIGPVMQFVFAVAPGHPLATASQPLSDADVRAHRAVAVADSVPQGNGITIGLLAGQDVLTVPSMAAKLDAQLRGMGAGFLPEPLAKPYIARGELVECTVLRPQRSGKIVYAWRDQPKHRTAPAGNRALQWWLSQLTHAHTRQALLGQAMGSPGSPRV